MSKETQDKLRAAAERLEAVNQPKVTKRRVTMRSVVLNAATGKPEAHEATDYVLPEHLDAYVADARTRWQFVDVSEKPDAGPGGYHGATSVPAGLPVPDAGVTYPAETKD